MTQLLQAQQRLWTGVRAKHRNSQFYALCEAEVILEGGPDEEPPVEDSQRYPTAAACRGPVSLMGFLSASVTKTQHIAVGTRNAYEALVAIGGEGMKYFSCVKLQLPF